MESVFQGLDVYGTVGDYRLLPVFDKTTEAIRQKIIGLWKDNHALPQGIEPDERAKQALFVVLGPQDRLVAVSTVYVSDLQHTGVKDAPPDRFYCYRMFINPDDRVGHLAKTMVTGAYDYLKALAVQEKPKGIVAVAHNKKLMRRGLQLAFRGIGWTVTGKDPQGHFIYRRDF